jgi:hypothetical protein
VSNGLYILDESGEKPVRCDHLEKWAHWFEDSEQRRVAATTFNGGKIFVSTVFLGVDHSFGGDTPVLWETMVFDPDSRECDRCAGNREQALAMHAAMVERIAAVLALDDGIPAEA